MSNETFNRYVAEGQKLIEQHPDWPGGVDYETAASDQIASILHGLFDGEYKPEDHTVRSLLDHALRCYEGDQEEREDGFTDFDFEVQNEGTILVLHPLNDAAREWIDEHLYTEQTQWWGGGIVIEHRYVEDILDGIDGAGLTYKGWNLRA